MVLILFHIICVYERLYVTNWVAWAKVAVASIKEAWLIMRSTARVHNAVLFTITSPYNFARSANINIISKHSN